MQTKSHCHFCGNRLQTQFIEGRDRLYCDRCRRPIYENPVPATCVIVTNTIGELVLVKRGVEPKIGWWCLPGGFIELGEDPEQGALRELSEETGLAAEHALLLGVCTTSSADYHSVLMIGYVVDHFSGTLVPGDDATDAQWFNKDTMPPLAFQSHQQFINSYFHGPDPLTMDKTNNAR
jgi:ADP-ribose pyrophosphatase YjhB (NUDIX family)